MGTTLFNPATQACVVGFSCVLQATTAVTTLLPTTTTTLSATTKAVAFNVGVFCSSLSMGYYSYPGDTTCIPYIYCYPNNQVMIGVVYNCIGSTRYNPNLAYCVDGYLCGSNIQTSPAPTAPPTTTIAPSTTTKAPSTTTIAPPTTTTTTLVTTTPATSFDPDDMCSTLKRGYYLIPINSTSTALVYCYKIHKVKHGIVAVIFTNINPETTTTIQPVTSTSKEFLKLKFQIN